MKPHGYGDIADVSGGTEADAPSPWRAYQSQSTRAAAEMVSIGVLRVGPSPRTDGVSDAHVRALAEMDTPMPPIIVHRPTMRVIDGVHRLRATELSARDHIEVRFFDGDEDDAFVLAVEANTANGLPLSLADRKAAAARIVMTHPLRSDRWIAAVSGLAATTVGTIRKCSTVGNGQSNTRIGRDGRLRPIDSAEGRRLAGELMRADPNRSLRDIARTVGIAPSTVLDVRNRLRCGEDLVPARRERENGARAASSTPRRQVSDRAEPDLDPAVIMQTLRKDPSLRFNETGRALLRWLDNHTMISEAVPSVDGIPAHCVTTVAALARHNARFWAAFGERIGDLDQDGDGFLAGQAR
ncbi:streptomycin biosynthesis protein [Kibdelosporangium aridum]|uniref:Streptomycin biosynthesis protein n=1 Tax=Kibdelosporangium aridum TaxID=2030 RepID=A0A428ZRK6_KIBAR|nr:ParB/RepB/Spo0J family partition protein [Kibdelosporangium aridum]RSM90687.1 streptomycin biosynthesis protein [Kibdelosporangium aridum]